jgi:hypothetical protein
MSSCKSLSQNIGCKTLIPYPGSLLKAIQSLFQFVGMLRIMRILKPLWLFYIDLFLNNAI